MIFSRMINRPCRKASRFIGGVSGSVTTEAAFIFTFLVILCLAVIEYGLFLTTKGKAEAISHSLVAVIRERTHLYNDSETLTQDQVDQLALLAETMLGKNEKASFCLTVETLTFKEGSKKQAAVYSLFSGGAGSCQLRPLTPLTSFTDLSPWSNRNRWVPLYQVTLSVPVAQGSLKHLLQGVGALPERIVVSNIALRR